MAKKPTIKPNDEIVRKIKVDKNALYAKFKYLNKWLLQPDKNSIKPLIEDHKEFNSSLRYKLYNNFLSLPKIIWYINKYLNHQFQFFNHDPEELLRTFAQIIKSYGIRDTNHFNYSRYTTFKRDSFTHLIEQYCKESNSHFNSNEINCLFQLYELGIIKNDDIDDLKHLIEGRNSLSSDEKSSPIFQQPEIKINTTKSAEIVSFSNNLLAFKTRRSPCRDCPLSNKQSCVVDTNVQSPNEKVDIAIVANEMAIEEDILNQTPFSGEDGKFFRQSFMRMVEKGKLKYIITNASLCYPAGKEISPANLKKVLTNCKGMIDEIHVNFQPKLIILFGNTIKNNYGIKDKLSDISGTVVNSKYFCMPSPGEALKSKTHMDRYNVAMMNLERLIMSRSVAVENSIQSNENPIIENNFTNEVSNLPTSARIEKGDTLFNIETFGEKIVYVFVDSNRKKKYIIEDMNYPIYIKNGNYINCDYITDTIDGKIMVNSSQKQQLRNKLNSLLKSSVQ